MRLLEFAWGDSTIFCSVLKTNLQFFYSFKRRLSMVFCSFIFFFIENRSSRKTLRDIYFKRMYYLIKLKYAWARVISCILFVICASDLHYEHLHKKVLSVKKFVTISVWILSVFLYYYFIFIFYLYYYFFFFCFKLQLFLFTNTYDYYYSDQGQSCKKKSTYLVYFFLFIFYFVNSKNVLEFIRFRIFYVCRNTIYSNFA